MNSFRPHIEKMVKEVEGLIRMRLQEVAEGLEKEYPELSSLVLELSEAEKINELEAIRDKINKIGYSIEIIHNEPRMNKFYSEDHKLVFTQELPTIKIDKIKNIISY